MRAIKSSMRIRWLAPSELPWNARSRYPLSAMVASRSVFEGIVPVRTQTPPMAILRSISATRLPSLAAWIAAR